MKIMPVLELCNEFMFAIASCQMGNEKSKVVCA